MSKPQNDLNRKKNFRNHKLKRAGIIAIVVVVLGGIAWAKFSGHGGLDEAGAVFEVKRGNLRISVTEPGKIEANKSVSLTCEVEGQSTIISIVPEGTYVKEEDVLVQLDSADLRERIDEQEITVKSAENAFKNADEALEIQKNQNESDIKAAQLTVDFAKIDLEKYTAGESDAELSRAAQAALDFVNRLLSDYAKGEWASQLGETQPDTTGVSGNNENESGREDRELSLDFAEMGLDKLAGGDWHQQLRNNLFLIVQADTRLKLAKDTVEGTRELYKKKYVTQTQLKGDESSFQEAVINLKKAVEALRLLVNYDHPKQLTKFLADYQEAQKELGRVKRRADSQQAQKESDKDAKEAAYERQQARLDKLKDQLKKTRIVAPQPGLVIYSSSGGDMFRRDRGLIAEGEQVYERQRIIELPDLSTLKVNISVHESVRDMVKPRQEAIITIEAVSGLMLRGHVEKVAILPDSGQRWMNPDITVYSTSIIIDNQSDALKPGMTAEAEIIIADLKDVLYVPVHAVTVRGEQEVCFAMKGSKRVITPVEVGLSNDNYIEIKSGLKEGDQVLTYVPITLAQETSFKKPKSAEPETKETPKPDETPSEPTATEERPRRSPEQMRERAKAFLQNLTPEQKKEMGIDETTDLEKMTPEQMRELFRKIMQRRGGPRPGGERPRGGPPGEGRRPGRGSGEESGPPRGTREGERPGNP